MNKKRKTLKENFSNYFTWKEKQQMEDKKND